MSSYFLTQIKINGLERSKFYCISYFIILTEFLTILYTPALFGDFVFDDFPIVVSNYKIRDIKNTPVILKEYFTGENSRPLRLFTYMIDYNISRLKPYSYHIQNFIWYLFNILIVFSIIRRIQPDILLAYFVTTIFALHPVQTEVVSYISGRRDLLYFFFYILAFYYAIQYEQNSKKKLGQEIIIVSLYFLSLFSKETAITFPAILFLYDYYKEGSLKNIFKLKKRLYLMIGVMSLIYMVIIGFISPYTHMISDKVATLYGQNYLYHLATVFKIHVHYLKLLFYPKTLILDYSNYILDTKSFSEPFFIFSFFIISGLIGLGLYLFRKRNLFGYLILFHFITLFPVSHIFPYHELMAERYLYLPTISFSIAISIALMRIVHINRYFRNLAFVFIIVIAFLFSLKTYQRNLEWNSSTKLYKKDAERNPKAERLWMGLAGNLIADRQIRTAEKLIYDMFQSFGGGTFKIFSSKIYENLGFIQQSKFNYEKAIWYYEKAVMMEPNKVHNYLSIGDCYFKMKKYTEALKFYEKMLTINNKSIIARFKLASCLMRMKEYNKALEKYIELEKIDKNDIGVLFKIATIYGILENYAEAIKYYEKIYLLNPEYPNLLVNMGIVYFKIGNLNRARLLLSKELSRNPENAQAKDGIRAIEGLK